MQHFVCKCALVATKAGARGKGRRRVISAARRLALSRERNKNQPDFSSKELIKPKTAVRCASALKLAWRKEERVAAVAVISSGI